VQRAAVALVVVGLLLAANTTFGVAGAVLLLVGVTTSLGDALLRSDAVVAARWALALGIVTILSVLSLWYSPAALLTGPLALFLAWIAHRVGGEPRVVRAAVVTAGVGLALLVALGVYLLVAE
jgi:hypothetical protein